jgi:hypothetical protein
MRTTRKGRNNLARRVFLPRIAYTIVGRLSLTDDSLGPRLDVHARFGDMSFAAEIGKAGEG